VTINWLNGLNTLLTIGSVVHLNSSTASVAQRSKPCDRSRRSKTSPEATNSMTWAQAHRCSGGRAREMMKRLWTTYCECWDSGYVAAVPAGDQERFSYCCYRRGTR
jgi:hypothetical protein